MVSQNKLMEDMNDFVTLKIWHCSDIDRSTKSPSFCKIMENCSPTKCRILCFFYFSYFTVSGSGLSRDHRFWIFVSFCCLNSFLWTMLGGAIMGRIGCPPCTIVYIWYPSNRVIHLKWPLLNGIRNNQGTQGKRVQYGS